MSNGPTLRERIATVETRLNAMDRRIDERHDEVIQMHKNHLHTHDRRDKWMMGILSGLVIGVVLLALRLWIGGI